MALPNRQRWAWLTVLLAGLALRLTMAWLPTETLIQKTLPDDAFYYFAIARNVVQGHGITLNGLEPTNGFHPLWATLLLLPYHLAGTQVDLPLHLGLTLGAVLDTLTLWLAGRIVYALTQSRAAALTSGLLYAFMPTVVMESVNGLETALSTALYATVLCFYLVHVRSVQGSAWRRYLFLGFLGGLTVLARTDTAFLLLFIAIDLLLVLRGGVRQEMPSLLVGMAIFFVVLAPWLWWNRHTFGTVMQSSGVAFPTLTREYVLADGPFSPTFRTRATPFVNLSLLLFWRYSGVSWTVLLASLLLARILRPWLRKPAKLALRQKLLPLWPAVLGAATGLLLHTFYRWYPRSWYYVPLAFGAALLAGVGYEALAQTLDQASFSGRWLMGGLTVGVVIVLALQSAREWRTGFYPWQEHMFQATYWVADHTEPDAVIGAFNAGMMSYYSRRTTLNLDGVTSWSALDALRGRRVLEFIVEQGVDYLVDYQGYILDSYLPYYGQDHERYLQLESVLSPEYPPYGAVAVYRVTPP